MLETCERPLKMAKTTPATTNAHVWCLPRLARYIGSLTERLDKMADSCFHIHYIDVHGLSPFETQYGLVTLIILRFPKEFL